LGRPGAGPAGLRLALERDGWFLACVKGLHHQFKRPVKPSLMTVKHPDGDIPKGTLNSIKKQAGWK